MNQDLLNYLYLLLLIVLVLMLTPLLLVESPEIEETLSKGNPTIWK